MNRIVLTAAQLTAISEHTTATDEVRIEDTNLDCVVAVTRCDPMHEDDTPFLVDPNGVVQELGEPGDDQR